MVMNHNYFKKVTDYPVNGKFHTMTSPSHVRGFHGNVTLLSDVHLMELAERLHPSNYRPLGLRLRFTEIRLSQIEHSRLGIITECTYEMLTEWKRREGKEATPLVLIQSVRDCNNSEAADWLQSGKCGFLTSLSEGFT